MVASEASLDFCRTIVGWALPEITLVSRLHFHYMRNTFSSCLCSPAAPLSLSASLSLPLSNTLQLHRQQSQSKAMHLHNNRSSHNEK